MDTILPLYNNVYFVEGQSENEVFLIFFFIFFFFFFLCDMRHNLIWPLRFLYTYSSHQKKKKQVSLPCYSTVLAKHSLTVLLKHVLLI